MLRTSIISIILVLASFGAMAQTDAMYDSADSPYTIVDVINSANGTVYIYQPQELDAIVGRGESIHAGDEISQAAGKNIGYRVQIFSDNNMRTAKAQAEYRKHLIEQQTPMRAYLTYDSPYWRVRVGDFKSQSEADAAMRELKNLFPNYARDFRLVRERINVVSQ